MTYETREMLRTIGIWTSTFAVIILLAVGYNALLTRANAHIESNCRAQNGQTLVTPGELSQCLLPAAL